MYQDCSVASRAAKPTNIKPISELPTLASFFFGTYVLRDKSTRNNQEAQIAETHQFQRRRQNKEWNSRMWGINIDKLYEKRHIEQNGFRISQAQN